jgi:hypothetical protein
MKNTEGVLQKKIRRAKIFFSKILKINGLVCSKVKTGVIFAPILKVRSHSRVVRHSSAKAATAVRIRM